MDARFGLLLACFFLSGFAALIYQTAWTRELSFVFGTSELAVAAVLAAYMGGLACGAAAAARLAPRLRRPVLTYGVLELAIAVSALLVPVGIRGVNAAYVSLLGGRSDLPEAVSTSAALFQLAGAFVVLLPPTAFMGATLPLLARHAVRSEAEIGTRVGSLYAVNTAGAIAGTLCAAFWLMPEFGLRRTVWLGATLNAAVFGLAVLLARGGRAPLAVSPTRNHAWQTGSFWILPAIAVSGVVSFSYEVLWTRLLGHLLGASLHAFATMLATFLLGIALGSFVAARAATTRDRAAFGFTLAQLGIALTSYVSFALADRLPELSARLGAGAGAALANAAVASAAMLPITLCIGATFPFAVRVLAPHPEQAAAATARVYAWNTVGAIAGALGAGFVLLPRLGYAGTLSVGVVLSLCLAGLAAVAASPRRPLLALVALVGGIVLAVIPVQSPWSLLISSPMKAEDITGEVTYAAVGRTSTVLLLDQGTHYRLSSNGLPEAAIARPGMLTVPSVTHWLGMLPGLLRPEARDLLVVGLGGGTLHAFVARSFETIDTIELEPEVLNANRLVADVRGRDPLSDPRLRVHIGDARGALRLTEKRYDAIVSQPSHPWTAGASHLYTKEFFSLVRSRLNPDGVFIQWIGIRFVDEALLRTLFATLLEVFPHVEFYRPDLGGMLFVASGTPIDGLENAARALRASPADFARIGLQEITDVASAWALDEAGVRALAKDAPLNTDDHNFLASRASRLGSASLDRDFARALLRAHDPLLRDHGLERLPLIRRLTALGQADRATDLAMAGSGATEEVGLGWVELAAGRLARARRHFERALTLSPADPEALAGLVASHKRPLSLGEVVPRIADAALDPRLEALIAAWRAADAGDWEVVAAVDAELGRIEPTHGLFGEASRLRIRQRIASADPQASVEALGFAEALLLRRWHPGDALLRARAANRAGQPDAAWGALQRVAAGIQSDPRGRLLAERVLEIADDLPNEMSRSLRLALARRMGRAPPTPEPGDSGP